MARKSKTKQISWYALAGLFTLSGLAILLKWYIWFRILPLVIIGGILFLIMFLLLSPKK